MQEFENLSTDVLLELLPDHLNLCHNSNAPENDRWRFYNKAHEEYIEPGASSARELLLDFIATHARNNHSVFFPLGAEILRKSGWKFTLKTEE